MGGGRLANNLHCGCLQCHLWGPWDYSPRKWGRLRLTEWASSRRFRVVRSCQPFSGSLLWKGLWKCTLCTQDCGHVPSPLSLVSLDQSPSFYFSETQSLNWFTSRIKIHTHFCTNMELRSTDCLGQKTKTLHIKVDTLSPTFLLHPTGKTVSMKLGNS